jgi:hypothetical protein
MILKKMQTNLVISSMRSYSKMLCVARTIADLRMVREMLQNGDWLSIENKILDYNDAVQNYSNKVGKYPYDYNELNCNDINISFTKKETEIFEKILSNSITITDVAAAIAYANV